MEVTPVAEPSIALPEGARMRSLATRRDRRRAVTENFRRSWEAGIEPVPCKVVRSEPGVFRGVHVHMRHEDHVILLEGSAAVGMRDLRPHSATSGMTALVEMDGHALTALTIPPGVAHGFYYRESSLLLYALLEYRDPNDALVCHWADPALEIPWPARPTILSPRDAAAPPLRVLARQMQHRLGNGSPAPRAGHAVFGRVTKR